MNIIAFAFKRNISSNVLEKLNIEKKHFVNSNDQDIKNLVEKIIKEKPDYILGLGMYSRVDKDKLRIETYYSKNKKRLPINFFLKASKNTKLANGIGNSYCNTVSTLIMDAINNKQVNSKYTFIHIPKCFDINVAVLEIEKMLHTSTI